MCFLGFLETAKALSKQNLAIELLEYVININLIIFSAACDRSSAVTGHQDLIFMKVSIKLNVSLHQFELSKFLKIKDLSN